jgi:hypothetical protein
MPRARTTAAPEFTEPAPVEDDSPAPEAEPAAPPTFRRSSRKAAESRPSDPLDPSTTTVEAGSSGGVDEAPPAPSTASTDRKSTPGLPRLDRAQVQAFTRIAGVIFTAAGALLNKRLRAHEQDPSFLPDDDDIEAVAPPLGRIGARHGGIPGGESVSDVSDAIEAVIGLAFYGIKNITRRAAARADRRPVQAAPQVDDQADEQAAAAPAPAAAVSYGMTEPVDASSFGLRA